MLNTVHEGYVLKLYDGTLWLAKWNIHDNFKNIVALPWRTNGVAKFTTFHDKLHYAKSKYPYLIKVVEAYNKVLPVIPKNYVRKVYDPFSEAKRVVFSPLPHEKLSRELILLLISEANIDLDDIGLVHSSTTEPIIVSRGKLNAYKIYNAIRRLFFTTNMFNHLEPGSLFNVKSHDIYVRISNHVLKSLYSRKYLNGVFNSSITYTIRLLEDEIYGFEDLKVKSFGRVTLLAKIVDDRKAIFYPSRYGIEVLSIAEGNSRAKFASEIIAFNDGFREAAWEGSEVLVQGVLEKVIDNIEGREYYRVSVGFSKDLILPLQRKHIPLYA